MTKQQFLDGKEFTIGNSNFRLSDDKGSITVVYRTSDGEELFVDNEGNIDKIGTKTFTTYTFVMGRIVKQKHRFEDLELYNAE